MQQNAIFMKAPMISGIIENFGKMVQKKLDAFNLKPKANQFASDELQAIDKVKEKKVEIWQKFLDY